VELDYGLYLDPPLMLFDVYLYFFVRESNEEYCYLLFVKLTAVDGRLRERWGLVFELVRSESLFAMVEQIIRIQTYYQCVYVTNSCSCCCCSCWLDLEKSIKRIFV